MPAILQVRNLRDATRPLRNWNMPLRLYYDETNNIRRLKLSEVGLNAPDAKTFLIGGIALTSDGTLDGWDALRERMRIQASANEVKSKHVAPGDYEAALGSYKLALFLNWLLERNILIRYSALDVLYWSVLDIVESLMLEDSLDVVPYHFELKNELHHIVSREPGAFFSLLHDFAYPNVAREAVAPFLAAVGRFLLQCAPDDRNQWSTRLRRAIERAAHRPELELPFLHDNKEGELISDFSLHFLHCVYMFKNASHTFDRETFVENALETLEMRDGDRRLDYRFADSKDDIGIQISDVITGLLGRHFSYIQAFSLARLRERKAAFGDQQRENLQLLRLLIDRSDALSDGLFHVVLPLDTVFKNNAFLHDQEVPDFLE